PQPVAHQPVMQQPVMQQPAAPQPVMQAPMPQPVAIEPAPAPMAEQEELVFRPVAAQPAPVQAHFASAMEQVIRPQRLPSIEDLPMPVQRQAAAPVAQNPVEAKRRTLRDRLAHWGMARSDEAPAAHQPAPTPSVQQRPAAPTPTHAEYAKRPAPAAAGRLDLHGRPAPVARQSEDDQLDIPAFLRRQTS
ncbi:MAG: cell division protein FtsZ, partial [Rhizobiales bacterium]|nr:cell division protein FtsZ [Hyphomicrobiales bacterium]